MDKIEDFKKKRNLNEIIKIAASSVIDKLKKYYKYTDALVYTVSTGMFIPYFF
jgi:predicted transcriptional regulator